MGEGRGLKSKLEKRIHNSNWSRCLANSRGAHYGPEKLFVIVLNIKLAIRMIGAILSLWGLITQKLVKQAYEQSPGKVPR